MSASRVRFLTASSSSEKAYVVAEKKISGSSTGLGGNGHFRPLPIWTAPHEWPEMSWATSARCIFIRNRAQRSGSGSSWSLKSPQPTMALNDGLG
jgi:hypothetical protein